MKELIERLRSTNLLPSEITMIIAALEIAKRYWSEADTIRYGTSAKEQLDELKTLE